MTETRRRRADNGFRLGRCKPVAVKNKAEQSVVSPVFSKIGPGKDGGSLFTPRRTKDRYLIGVWDPVGFFLPTLAKTGHV